MHELFMKALNQTAKFRVYQKQTSTGPKRIKTVNQGNTGVRQEGQVGRASQNEDVCCEAP